MREDEKGKDVEGIQNQDEPQQGELMTKDFSKLIRMLGEFQDKINNQRVEIHDEAMQHLNMLTSIINEKLN